MYLIELIYYTFSGINKEEACTKYPPTVKAHLWKKPTEKNINSCHKWDVFTIEIHVKEKNSARSSSLIYLCCSLFLLMSRLVSVFSSLSSSAYLCASLSGVPALQGHAWISAQWCQSPEFLCSQARQLVTPDITRKKTALEKNTADALHLH